MRLWLAVRVFWRALLDPGAAARFEAALQGAGAETATSGGEPAKPDRPRRPSGPLRSDAITLLATLQREARFVDIVKEPLGQYSDAQIGAAARDVLRDCGDVLERLFALRPVAKEEEGEPCEATQGYDPGRCRLTGNVQGPPPFRGRLSRHGWEATRCELPQWSGGKEAARVIAPMEIELP